MRIQQAQRYKARRERDVSMRAAIESTMESSTRMQRRMGTLLDLWCDLVPEELARHTAIVSLKRGVLQVEVDSAPAGFELDRLLRSGLEPELRRRFNGTLSRVKVKQSKGTKAPRHEGTK